MTGEEAWTSEVSEKGKAFEKHVGQIQVAEGWLRVWNSDKERFEHLRWWTQEPQFSQKIELQLLLTKLLHTEQGNLAIIQTGIYKNKGTNTW